MDYGAVPERGLERRLAAEGADISRDDAEAARPDATQQYQQNCELMVEDQKLLGPLFSHIPRNAKHTVSRVLDPQVVDPYVRVH